jgi:hypothetical protein
LKGTQLGIENNKVVKWIIEVAALMTKTNYTIDSFDKECCDFTISALYL